MKHFLLTFFLAMAFLSQAQQPDSVTVGTVSVVGNEQTRLFVINRETDVKTGDRIAVSEIQHRLLRNEQLLLNTRLFVSVDISTVDYHPGDSILNILIDVKETWYLFPFPVFKLADRNFNVWWEDFDHDFSRVIWGARGHHYNLTGVRDYLKVVAQFGFAEKYQIRYRYPYLNKKGTLGLELDAAYSRARNGAFNTFNDQLLFIRSEVPDNFTSFYTSTTITYRPEHIVSHEVGLRFVSSAISDTVMQLNPSYYLDQARHQRYVQFDYIFRYDRRDRSVQAKQGYFIEGRLRQRGMGIYDDVNFGFAQLHVKHFSPVTNKITARISTKGRWHFNKKAIPYNHSQALGYGTDYVRGYEHYVIDGNDFFLSHQGLTWEFLDLTLNFEKILPIDKVDVIPLRFYLSANADVAFVNTPTYDDENALDHRWLYGYGPSLEILLAESYLFGVDYSFNHLGESGMFIHTKFNF